MPHTTLISIVVLGLLSLFSGVYTLFVWARRRRFTKEHFAFAALSSIVTLTTSFFAVVASPAPWDLLAQVLSRLFDEPVSFSTPSPFVYALVTLGYVFSCAIILTMFRRWDGLRSEHQYSIEQRTAEMSLLLEGFNELVRLLSRRHPPAIHHTSATSFPSQLDTFTPFVPWRDRARVLVQLKTPFYAFPGAADWHDREQCWAGIELNTGDFVMLRCAADTTTEMQLSSFVEYADRVRSQRAKSNMVLILAVENSAATPIHGWHDIPIHFETEETLLNGLVNWLDYRSDILKRMTQTPLPDSNFTTADVFVEPVCTPSGGSHNDAFDLRTYLQQWLDDPTQRHVALLGDYGQGKSTAVLAFAHHQLTQGQPDRVPVLIELRGTSPRNLTPLQLLGAWAANYNINPQALFHLHMAGRLLLIFDGFDEMALVGDAELRLKHFKTLWAFCFSAAKILITGRPNFFFDQREMTAALGISEPSSGKPYCEAIRLKPFDSTQIRVALRHQDAALRDEICSFAEQNDQFRELISRPSLLHVVTVLWRKEDLSKHRNELTSAYVMRLFVRQSYRRQGQKEEDSPDFMALTNEERHYFMKGVATYMAARRLPNQITGQDLNDAINSLIENIPDAVSYLTPAITGESRIPLRTRLMASEHGLEHVQTDVRTCGLLVDDPSAPGAFRFGHKSFMEYLFAEVVGDHISDTKLPDTAAILTACGATAADVETLPASVSFLSEILKANSAGVGKSRAQEKKLAKRILRLRLLLGYDPVKYASGRLFLYQSTLVKASKHFPAVLRLIIPTVFGLYFAWFHFVRCSN